MLFRLVFRLAVLGAVLAAAYLLVVRPALDTTSKAVDAASKPAHKAERVLHCAQHAGFHVEKLRNCVP